MKRVTNLIGGELRYEGETLQELKPEGFFYDAGYMQGRYKLIEQVTRIIDEAEAKAKKVMREAPDVGSAIGLNIMLVAFLDIRKVLK